MWRTEQAMSRVVGTGLLKLADDLRPGLNFGASPAVLRILQNSFSCASFRRCQFQHREARTLSRMLSIRALSRSIPRVVTRSCVSAFRPLSTVSRPSFQPSAWKSVQRITHPAFSTTSSSREAAGESDQELAAKIDQELRLEKESKDPAVVPPEVQTYIDKGIFQIEDVPGTEVVVLTRSIGDETIKVSFTIAEMNDEMSEDMSDPDNALEDEEDMDLGQSKRTINQSGTRGGDVDVMAEDSIAPADRAAQGEPDEVAGEEQMPATFETNFNITITKPGKGAVQINATTQDGMVEIHNVFYFPKADVAIPKTAEKMHARQDVYAGPPFGNLDADLQAMLERYIDERGINTELAQFIPNYIDYKEQREYVQWLDSKSTNLPIAVGPC